MSPVSFILMNPSGNRTILVRTAVDPDDQPSVAAKLLALEPKAEQAGFLSDREGCDTALRMAGGEFCGNASMCAAVYFAMETGMREGMVRVSVSGAPKPVSVSLQKEEGHWFCTVQMPEAESVEEITFPNGEKHPVVRFEGITHVILEEAPREDSEALLKEWCAFLETDAAGLMYLDRREGTLTPLVYVPNADTMFWENACGSGTAACAAYCFKQKKTAVRIRLKQPGGILEASCSEAGELFLCGTVEFEYQKTAEL